VLRVISDEVVVRVPGPRNGRRGPAPPPPPDVLGPVLRVLVLTAAMTGLRQSELIGLRWRDVDWAAQRIRCATRSCAASTRAKASPTSHATLRGRSRIGSPASSTGGRSARSTGATTISYFAHPQLGRPLDGAKVSRRFREACIEADVRQIRFHDLRHTFATRLAASGQPLRAIQEFLVTPTSRRRRSMLTTRPRHTRCRWSTKPLSRRRPRSWAKSAVALRTNAAGSGGVRDLVSTTPASSTVTGRGPEHRGDLASPCGPRVGRNCSPR